MTFGNATKVLNKIDVEQTTKTHTKRTISPGLRILTSCNNLQISSSTLNVWGKGGKLYWTESTSYCDVFDAFMLALKHYQIITKEIEDIKKENNA
jgi:hypothetical protein